jgi:hypothetical protein
MSHVDGQKSLDPYIHFKAGMKDLFRFDQVRLVNILGSIQYGLLYAFVFFFAGIGIESVFPKYNPIAKFKTLASQVTLQCIVIIIVIFYARKLVEAIPGIITFFPKAFNQQNLLRHGFIPYGIDEFKGEAMMSIILIGTSVNLLKKIGRLADLGEMKFL